MIDLCAEARCDERATCAEVNGDAVCTCNQGLRGNGFYCEPGQHNSTTYSYTTTAVFIFSFLQHKVESTDKTPHLQEKSELVNFDKTAVFGIDFTLREKNNTDCAELLRAPFTIYLII